MSEVSEVLEDIFGGKEEELSWGEQLRTESFFTKNDLKANTEKAKKFIKNYFHDAKSKKPEYFFIAYSAKSKGYYMQKSFSNVDEIQSLSYRYNVYFTPNSFYCRERSNQRIRKLKALYIDVDCRREPFKSLDIIHKYIFKHGILPYPHFVTFSGRGIQIIWIIHHTEDKRTWQKCQDYIHSVFKKRYPGWFDSCAQKRMNMNLKLPFTRSYESGNYTAYITISDPKEKIALKDFKKYIPKPKKQKGEKPKQKPYKKLQGIKTDQNLRYLIKTDIETLVDLREGHMPRCRMNCIFLLRLYMAKLGYAPEETLNYALWFNRNKFRDPLPEEEIEEHSWTAHDWPKKQFQYRHKIKTIIDKLRISTEEQKNLKILTLQKSAKQRNKSGMTQKQKKQRSISLVKEALQEEPNLSIRQIAKKTELSRSYVQKILKNEEL